MTGRGVMLGMIAAALLATPSGIAAARHASSADTVRTEVPGSLTALESSAEDIVDYALAHDREKLVAAATTMRQLGRGDGAASLAAAGVSDKRIAALRTRSDRVAELAPRGSFVAVALAANAVSALMPEFYSRFTGRTSALLLKLDYLDREVELRSLAGQRTRIPAIVRALEGSWVSLRPTVVKRGVSRLAGAFDDHVAAMKRLSPAKGKRLRGEAVNGLELVDQLETALG